MDIDTYTETVGAAMIPFTFPTVAVRNHLVSEYGFDLDYGEIDTIWDAYKAALQSGRYTRYENSTASRNLLLHLRDTTGIELSRVLAWCKTVKDLAVAGDINRKWWSPEAGKQDLISQFLGRLDLIFYLALGVGTIYLYKTLRRKRER